MKEYQSAKISGTVTCCTGCVQRAAGDCFVCPDVANPNGCPTVP